MQKNRAVGWGKPKNIYQSSVGFADCRLRSESALRFFRLSRLLGVNHAELSAEFRAGRDVFLYRDPAGAETGFVGSAAR